MVFSPQFVSGIVKQIFPGLRKTQRINLSLAVVGQVISQTAILSQIVREIPGTVKHKYRLKRLWRFLTNPRIKPERLTDFWVPWIITRFARGHQAVIALDWTGLPGNYSCLVASLVLYGRAIPLLWQVVEYSQLKDSINLIEQRLITHLSNLIPTGYQWILVADRGFGRAKFIQFLLAKSIWFVIRVRSDVRVQPIGKRAFLLSTLAKKLVPETANWYPQISYRNDGIIPAIGLAAIVAKGSKDPWFLVTNLTSEDKAIETYQQRFQIEEGFKDFKHALGFEKIQTRNLMLIRRLILVTAIAQALLLLIGKLAFRMENLKATLITGKTACSRVWLAIQIVKRKLLGQSFWSRVKLAALGP